jgi:hypothetical protein
VSVSVSVVEPESVAEAAELSPLSSPQAPPRLRRSAPRRGRR